MNDPLGEPAGSFDLGILDFTVPGDGVYTLRVTSWVEGRYGLVVTDAMVFDGESDAFRSLDKTEDALGYLGGQDDVDWYTITLAAGEVWVIHTETPLDGIKAMPRNDLDPGLVVVAPGGQTVVAANSDSAPDGKNAGICLVAPADGIYRIGVTAESGQGEYLLHAAEGVNVLARRLFYNNSLADGDDPAANEADDQAIATDKHALLPGETASFANYSSYDRGINGIMIDIPALAGRAQPLGVDDFEFRVGNSNDPSNWMPARGAAVDHHTTRGRRPWGRSRGDPLGRPRDRSRVAAGDRQSHRRLGPRRSPTSSISATPSASRATRPATRSSTPPTKSLPGPSTTACSTRRPSTTRTTTTATGWSTARIRSLPAGIRRTR